MSTHKNSEIHLRPRFSIDLDESHESVISRFKNTINFNDCKFKGKIIDDHIIIDVRKEEDHFWSPQLHLEIEEVDKEKSILKGLFGPKSQVWTFFMFIHFALGIALVSFLIIIYTRKTLNNDVTFPVVMIILVLVLWIAMYFIGKEGKKKGKSQMNEINNFMLQTLNKKTYS